MASGERRRRSHVEANRELFDRIDKYSEELKSAERNRHRGEIVMDAFFSQFDTPVSTPRSRGPNHDIKVSVYNPDLEAPRHNIGVKLYDPDNPDPEPEPPKPRETLRSKYANPYHGIEVKLYDPDNSDLETNERESTSAYERLSRQEAKEVFAQASFKDEESMDYIYKHAAPKYKLDSVGGAEIYLSEIVPDKKRPHVVAYVKAEGKETIEPNIFYRSRSSMLWRLLPQLRRGGGYGKSNYEENAINAPFELQSTIQDIFTNEQKDPDYIDKYSDDKSVRKICDEIDSSLTPDDRGEGNLTGIIEERFIGNKESLTPGYYSFGHAHDLTPMAVLSDPEECTVPGQLSPDFSHPVHTWKTGSEVYGDVTARCFNSKDGTLQYLIFQDKDGDSWVGGIECANAKTSSVGLKEQFVSPGSLTTPLYEYHIPHEAYQDGRKGGGFWGDPNKRHYPYNKMNQYTSRIPMLREFNRQYSNEQKNMI